MRFARWIALPLLFALATSVPAADAPPLAVKVERNILYSTAGGEKLRLDLAMPAAGGPYPAVLMLHGGAWSMGNRADLSRPGRDENGRGKPSAIEAVAARGYVAVSASYRLAPKHKFPAQIEDARTAVRFLRANAKQYHLDPQRIAAAGFSAGGHLALLLGVAGKTDFTTAELAEQSSEVQCVVSFFGPTDLNLYAASPGLEDAYMVPWLGKSCKTDPAVYKRASPLCYSLKTCPPVLMIHGTADIVVPIIHSERMLKKLLAAGVKAELITVKGEGHGWTGAVAEKTMVDAVQFLNDHLKGKP